MQVVCQSPIFICYNLRHDSCYRGNWFYWWNSDQGSYQSRCASPGTFAAHQTIPFAYLRAKAVIEEQILSSAIDFTILRTSIVFGPYDNFTEYFRYKLRTNPFFLIMPGDGKAFLQPMWIDDLLACLQICLRDESYINKTITIGGGEFIPVKAILRAIMQHTKRRCILLPLDQSYLRTLLIWLGESRKGLLPSSFWLDYCSADRTCALDTLPRHFGILPVRFKDNLDYL